MNDKEMVEFIRINNLNIPALQQTQTRPNTPTH